MELRNSFQGVPDVRRHAQTAFLPKACFQKNLGIIHKERAAGAEGLGILHAYQAADVAILGIVFIEQRRLIAAEDRLIYTKRRQLAVIHLGNINREIESLPTGLHAAVPEEKPVDLQRLGVVQLIDNARPVVPKLYFIPFLQPSIKDTIDDYVCNRSVVRVYAGT